MDTLSHGLWGYAALRHRGKRDAWLGFWAGMAPDLLFFIPSRIERIVHKGFLPSFIGENHDPNIWRANGPPQPPELLDIYHRYYTKTHSLVVVAAVVGLLLLLKKKRWAWLFVPYTLHIFMDIPTHERWTTPIFYPLSDWTFVGWSWAIPWIFFPNWIAVSLLLAWQMWHYKKKEKQFQ